MIAGQKSTITTPSFIKENSKSSSSSSNIDFNSAVSIFELIFFLIEEFIILSFILLRRFYCGCLVVYWKLIQQIQKILKFLYLPFKQNKAELSKVATKTGQDANAGWVSLCRYLSASVDSEFNIQDDNMKEIEKWFLSFKHNVIASLCCNFKLLMRAFTHTDFPYVVGRTILIDKLIKETLELKRTPNKPWNQQQQEQQQQEQQQQEQQQQEQNPRVFEQFVILGAGYDSRAYRFEKLRRSNSGTKNIEVNVIEIDQSSVQEKKIEGLLKQYSDIKTQKELEEKTGVEFVQCNFDHSDALRESLLKKSKKFDRNLNTIILWEGVSYYLTKSAVQNTLDTLTKIRKESTTQQPQWRLVFDLVDSKTFTSKISLAQRLTLERLAASRYPFLSGLPRQKDKLDDFLKQYGIQTRSVWNFLKIINEVFDVDKVEASLPFAVVDCEWIN